MNYLLKTAVGRITIYLTAYSFIFLQTTIPLRTPEAFASDASYEKTEKELEGVMEESKAAISGEKKTAAPLIDEEPPMIMHTPVQTAGKQDIQIQATIEDASEVKEATLLYRVKGNESFEDVKMKRLEGNTYMGVIPADKVSFAGMEYYIEASDSNNNTATDGSKDVVYPIFVEGVEVEKNLETAEKPIYKKWWFWTLAAVAAGGAAALAGGGGGGGGGGNSGGSSGSSGSPGGGGTGTGTVTGTW